MNNEHSISLTQENVKLATNSVAREDTDNGESAYNDDVSAAAVNTVDTGTTTTAATNHTTNVETGSAVYCMWMSARPETQVQLQVTRDPQRILIQIQIVIMII